MRAGTYYLSESMLDPIKAEKIRNEENLINEISYEGKGPEEGQLYVNEHSDVALAVKYGNKCYKKEYTGNIISLDYNPVTCKLNINIEKPAISITADNVFNELGWSKENFYVTINTVDHSGLGATIKWCGTSNETCEPTTVINDKTGHIQFTQETDGTKVCAKAIDGFENESNTICSNAYKLDKTNPSFTGIEDITVSVGGSVDLTSGVGVSDSLSGIKGTFTYNPTSIDTSKTGSYPVTYHVEDNAGNTKEITRNVIVNSNNPTIGFTATEESINSNGWAKSNFYVTVNTTDYSGHGIEKVVWCGTTSNTCTPSTEVSGTSQNVLISQESNNNRICAYAIDKGGHTGSTTCSDAYKLDKTSPTAGTLNISGTLGSNNWYTSDVSLAVNAGSDSLSGHATSTSNITSITSNTTGTTITVTTSDLAGNTSTRDYTIKVDKNAPTLTAKSESVTIVQGTSNAVSSYFNTPTYSISGGNWSCSPTNTSGLTAGNQTVSCTATGGNGLTTTASKIILIKKLTPDFYLGHIELTMAGGIVASQTGYVKKFSYTNSWNNVDLTNSSGASIAVSAIDENNFYAVINGTLRKYSYNGSSWTNIVIASGLGTECNVSAINGNSLYLAVGSAVRKYTNNNGSWSFVNVISGLGEKVSVAAIDENNLYIGYTQTIMAGGSVVSQTGVVDKYSYNGRWTKSAAIASNLGINVSVSAIDENNLYIGYTQMSMAGGSVVSQKGVVDKYSYSSRWTKSATIASNLGIDVSVSAIDSNSLYIGYTEIITAGGSTVNQKGVVTKYTYNGSWSGSTIASNLGINVSISTIQ